MSSAENLALLREYVRRVWGEGNPDAVELFASESFVRHSSPLSPSLDRVEQIERLKAFRSAFPDIRIEVLDAVADADLVAFRSIMTGTHRGEFMGIPPTGRSVEVSLVDMIRVEDGRFVEQWGGPDVLDLLHQLGGKIQNRSDPEEE